MKFTKFEVRWDEHKTDEEGDVVVQTRSIPFVAVFPETAQIAALDRFCEMQEVQSSFEVLFEVQVHNLRVVRVTEEVIT